MKLKEKTGDKYIFQYKKETGHIPLPAAMILSAVFGYLAAGTNIGGSGVPLCVSAAAVLSPWNSLAAFAGAAVYMLKENTVSSSVTELIAMPAVIIAKAFMSAVLGRKLSPHILGILSGMAYVICGIIVSFSDKIRTALIFAVAFRGIICGAAVFLCMKVKYAADDNAVFSRENRYALAAVYVLAICTLCGADMGTLNAGRIAGGFIALEITYRAGCGSGGASAALASFAAGAASPAFLASSPIPICSALAAGCFRKKGKLAAAAAFLIAGSAGALIYGMPADALNLLADMSAASILFCAVPDRFLRKFFPESYPVGGTVSAAAVQYGERLKFAASVVADVRKSFSAASEILYGKEIRQDISGQVCKKVCSSCRNSAFCCENEEKRIENYFRAAEKILAEKGSVTVRDLHGSLDICPHRELLAETFNIEFYRQTAEKRLSDASRCMMEITSEQLESTEKMLYALGSTGDIFPFCDEELSYAVNEIVSAAGASNAHSALFTDRNGRVYIECFFEGKLIISPRELTEKLSAAADRELALPVSFRPERTTRMYFHEQENFAAEIGSAGASGRGSVSGDLGAVFEDGLGNLYVMLSDGMGSGARAAAESCMTVSAAVRMIRAGLGTEAAVKLVNILLLTKSSEEYFSTIDLLAVDLFTGKAEIIKLGAAQTFIKSCGAIRTVESRTTPVGIVSPAEIERRRFHFSDGDEVVMMTDGICEECFPEIRELMLSTGVTAQDCAERIIGIAEKNMDGDPCRRDDKTVYVVKLHKI